MISVRSDKCSAFRERQVVGSIPDNQRLFMALAHVSRQYWPVLPLAFNKIPHFVLFLCVDFVPVASSPTRQLAPFPRS